ncbi:helix-turn-helix transcriptional regulator [Mucilaginibacter sp. JRF]|uniref:helix-turn-helix transcriptional regulator n=1 Tax=Mucilaginibacter sp. JRF TaxID=2780088 RepID=UPI00187EA8FC|nr:AraC family transcriptional regulator [Mucilaginibacter sp. JRF]MBE9583154.1 helix-turn-helix transcriptional regulator [Mucilaginibacter sp. JRF]
MSYRIDTNDFPDFLTHFDNGLMSLGELNPGNKDIITFSTPKGDMSYLEEVVAGNIIILNGHYQFKDDIAICGKGDESLLEMHFNLSDTGIAYNNPIRNNKPVAPLSGNITYLNANDNRAAIGFREGHAYETFDIHLPLSLLSNFAGEGETIDNFLDQISREKSSTLLQNDILLNPKLEGLMQDIKTCPYQGITRRVYLEAKVYELVSTCLQGVQADENRSQFSNREIELIKETAQLIRANLDSPLTIIELARKAGINQTKLKSGFKHVFGDTIFSYLQKIRMNKAKMYLLDTQLTIQEISHLSGYQSISNFSIAFKRTFGCSPKTFRDNT